MKFINKTVLITSGSHQRIGTNGFCTPIGYTKYITSTADATIQYCPQLKF